MEDANGAANGLEVNEEKDKQPYDATACLYKLGCDKAFHKWNFMFMFDDENLMSLANFKRYLIKNHGLEEVARRFGIATSVFSITVHRTKKEPLFPTVVFYSSDSESKNKSAGEILNEERMNDDQASYTSVTTCIPDHVLVTKRYRQQLSNWFLLVSGYRINLVLLRTLKEDPALRRDLQCLPVSSVRNRDRMDVDSLLDISSENVLKVLDSFEVVVQTLVPERYRLYEGNKRGVLKSPTDICLGPYGKVLVVDAGKGALLSARLHYPVDVIEIAKGLKLPMSVDHHDGLVIVAESGADRIVAKDFDCKTLLNPNQMTAKQIEEALKERKIFPSDKGLHEHRCMLS